jgi:hypothetical protein
MGDARGRWEHDTLVVETTHFKDEPAYRGANPETLRLVERFTPVASDKIDWSVTVDDPTTWTRPWTFAMPLTRNDSEAVVEYASHEGNLSMANVLSAARAEERAGGRSAAPRGAGATAARPATTGAIATSLFAGTWVEAPQGGRGGRGNFAGFSAPTRITIVETPTDVAIETNTGTENQNQTAVYKLDGTTTVVPGPIGWDTRARAARQDGRLLVTITRSIDGPDGRLTFEIKDVYSVADGVLTLERTQGSRTRRMVYKKE